MGNMYQQVLLIYILHDSENVGYPTELTNQRI